MVIPAAMVPRGFNLSWDTTTPVTWLAVLVVGTSWSQWHTHQELLNTFTPHGPLEAGRRLHAARQLVDVSLRPQIGALHGSFSCARTL